MSKNSHGNGSVYERKDGRFVASVRYVDDKGRKRRVSEYANTRKEANAKLRVMLRRLEEGAPVTESNLTVKAWSERWAETTLAASKIKETTRRGYADVIRLHIVPGLGDITLRELNPSHVEAWLLNLGSRLSPSTVRQCHTVLGKILNTAMTHELVRRNVARLVDRPRLERKEAKHYSSDQVKALREAARGDRLEPFLTLPAYTGLRKGEALGLRWADVNLESKTPQLRVTGTLSRVKSGLLRSEPKSRSGWRTVPLVPEAVEAIREAKRLQARERLAAGEAWTDTGYVFTTPIGTPVDPGNALHWFYAVRDRAGIEEGSLHTLRHSAAAVLLAVGVPMPIVKDILGHSSITITVDMYGHMAPTVVADAMLEGMTGYGS